MPDNFSIVPQKLSHFVRKHVVRVISTRFANSSLRTISCRFFRQMQRMLAAQWVPCSSEFLFSSMFVGRFSYRTNNFHVTAGAVGSSFSPGSQEVRRKINFPNVFCEHNIRECIPSLTFHSVSQWKQKVISKIRTVSSKNLLIP